MSQSEKLRSLPSVDQILSSRAVAELAKSCPRQSLVNWIREVVDQQRQRILANESVECPSLDELAMDVMAIAKRNDAERLQHVINATGIMLHTNLGRSPLAQRAIDRVNQATRFTNVELDLASGKRSKRGQRVVDLLAQLTGAEDALVVNNCAAATMLVLQTMAAGREVVISRGQLVEIGGGFRLPNVFQAAGVRLREIGTTNRTHVRDYESAISEETAAIMRVHHSNFRQVGFVTEPTIAELIACDRPDDLPVIDDVGSGAIGDLSKFNIREPDVIASVAAGADVTLFSGDKLFGGPQAGIVVGRKRCLQAMRTNPLMRAFRVDKLTLAALEATTEIHLSGTAEKELPLMQMLSKSESDIRCQCNDLLRRIQDDHGVDLNRQKLSVIETESQVGGGSVPGIGIPSHAIRIETARADDLARQLRTGTPAVQARIADGAVLLDLRSVSEDELPLLSSRLGGLLVAGSNV
jgi:L-seryl-tRNA(Ser) seleniumtransferase